MINGLERKWPQFSGASSLTEDDRRFIDFLGSNVCADEIPLNESSDELQRLVPTSRRCVDSFHCRGHSPATSPTEYEKIICLDLSTGPQGRSVLYELH
jgi:hypothetical protein